MKGARWRALGTQTFFSSTKLPQNKKWQISQAPVIGCSCDCLSPGLDLMTLRGTGLLCHPSLQPWVFLLGCAMKVTHSVQDKAETQLSLSWLGCCLLILHKFCWQVGLNWFNSPVMSKKENCFLTGVRLDYLMDYLLSVSHFDDPVSNKPSSLLKHSRVVEPSQCEWKVLCRLISWGISVHIVKVKHITKKYIMNKKGAKEIHSCHLPRHKQVKNSLYAFLFQDRRQTFSVWGEFTTRTAANVWTAAAHHDVIHCCKWQSDVSKGIWVHLKQKLLSPSQSRITPAGKQWTVHIGKKDKT